MGSSLLEAVACDAFFQLVKATKEKDVVILSLMEQLLDKLECAPSDCPRHLVTSIESLKQAARAFVVIFHPVPGHRGTDVKDLVDVRSFRGSNNPLLSTLKAYLLSNTEEVGARVADVFKYAIGTKQNKDLLNRVLVPFEKENGVQEVGAIQTYCYRFKFYLHVTSYLLLINYSLLQSNGN